MAHTKSLTLFTEQRAVKAKLDREFNACVEEEFAPGTKVRWIYTYKRGENTPVYREGVVKKTSNGYVIATMGSHAEHRMHASNMEIVA